MTIDELVEKLRNLTRYSIYPTDNLVYTIEWEEDPTFADAIKHYDLTALLDTFLEQP